MIYADQRWIGEHGIGRFARHVLDGLEYRPLPLATHPAAALESLRLSQALRNLANTDLFFSPGYNAPLFCQAPFVFTIHDLMHIHCPEISKLQFRLYYATVMKRACHRARRILTVSEFTKKQILDWTGAEPEKVVNVGCGVSPEYKPDGDRYGLHFPYLLCVSNRKPHKNELRVLEAFAHAELDVQTHLVFTGDSTPELLRCADRCGIGSRVQFVGLVPEEKMPSLYRGAQALVFPSLYEGFGLPLVEAMACGTPVITSNGTSLSEVAGNAAVLIDPTSVEQIASAMELTLSDTSLRQRLRGKGLIRAAQFSWVNTVAKVHKALTASIFEAGATEGSIRRVQDHLLSDRK